MEHKETADITVGSGILAALGRIDEKTDQLFREFIDNSTSSFKDHEEELKKYEKCCKVKITWTNDEIIIQDNAYGMNKKEFLRALKLNAKADHYTETSRSKYGLGLKYAAANLGDWYQIETIEFKSCLKFSAVVDINDLEKNNPTTLPWTSADCSDDFHGTKITIKKLRKKLNTISKLKNKATKFDELIQNLGMIYSKDLKNHELELSINNTMVQYKRPEIWENENGNQYYCTIKDNTFTHEGKTYQFTGWAAIRKTADSSGAGFTLMQKDRAITLHYLPEDIFGKHNDFRYQRVFGDINLIGDSWTVTFTKNNVKWDNNGLEDAFISSLLNNKDLRYILDKAKKLRKDPPGATSLLGPKTATSSLQGSTPTYSSSSTNTTPSNPSSSPDYGNNIQLEPPHKNTASTTTNSDQPTPSVKKPINQTVPPTEITSTAIASSDSKREQHQYVYNNTRYVLNIDTKSNTDPKGNWLQASIVNEQNHEYNLDINLRTTFLKDFKKRELLRPITELAIVFFVAQIESSSIGLGLNNSKILVDKINEILKTENPFN